VVVADGAEYEAASTEIAPCADGEPPLMYVWTLALSVAVAFALLPAAKPPEAVSAYATAPSGVEFVAALEPSDLALYCEVSEIPPLVLVTELPEIKVWICGAIAALLFDPAAAKAPNELPNVLAFA
jgi:hypothetical protein